MSNSEHYEQQAWNRWFNFLIEIFKQLSIIQVLWSLYTYFYVAKKDMVDNWAHCHQIVRITKLSGFKQQIVP